MITQLTSAQESKFGDYIKKWTDIGLCTDPANRVQSEKGIIDAYVKGGLEPPKHIIWCSSPVEMILVRTIMANVGSNVRNVLSNVRSNALSNVVSNVGSNVVSNVESNVVSNVGSNVWSNVVSNVRANVWSDVRSNVRSNVASNVASNVRSNVWSNVRANVGSNVGSNVASNVRSNVWSNVRENVGSNVWSNVGSNVRANVLSNVGSNVWSNVWSCIYGQHEADWLAFYDYFAIELGLTKQTFQLSGLWKVAKNAGWWLPCEDVCFVSERHNAVNLDGQNRLHCEDGLAVSYPDGWGVYAWHGVRVPEFVIMRPQEITPDKILSEDNAEISRVMIERYGQDNFILNGGFKAQQRDQYGELYRVEFDNGDEPIIAVHVKDPSTDREYFLYVPPHVQTAHEAVSWTFGYDNVADYTPLLET